VRGGESFFPEQGNSDHIRLCYASLETSQLVEGAKRLGHALRKLKNLPARSGNESAAVAWV
jgi:DNA-binding transcriptional MocR family regulator